MKISLYLEFYHFWGGILFRKIGTGLLSSYRNQKTMLVSLGIPFTEKWDPSSDILQINTPWLKSIYVIKKAKRCGKKVIIWAHVTAEDAAQVFRFTRFIGPLVKAYLTYAYGLADLVFCPTEYTKSLLMAYGIPENRLVAQSNAVDLEKFYSDEKKRLAGRKRYALETLTIGTMGLVIPRKGIDTFLSLAERFPQHQFMWFGKIYSGLLVKPLPMAYAKNAVFTGYVDDILEAYNAIDIFIFPSYEENQGMAILEAAAVGLPIVVRDIPAYEGWLVHRENCLKAKTNQEFEDRIAELARDKGLRDTLGAQAKILAEGESIETLGKKLLRIYRELLGA